MDDQGDYSDRSGKIIRYVIGFLIALIPWGYAVSYYQEYQVMVERNRLLLESTGHGLPRTQGGAPLTLAFVCVILGLLVLAIAAGKYKNPTT